jgi:hypothetical protein
MTPCLETTIFSVRSLNLLPGAQANDGKGSTGPNRLPGGGPPKGGQRREGPRIEPGSSAFQGGGQTIILGISSLLSTGGDRSAAPCV